MQDTDSSIRLYIKEITETDLITPEKEIELAARIAAGDEKAREHLIKANLRLVVKIARDYSNFGVPMADLISEGNIGLMKAVDKFDPEKGGKLSTYASWWIKQAVKRALANQGKTVRLPVHLVDKIARVRRISDMMAEAIGRQPSDEELAEELGLPIKKLKLLKRAAKRPESLDAPAGDESAMTNGETIGDTSAASPFEALETKNHMEELEDLLELLDQREAAIIGDRFGLNGKKSMTLEEIGVNFGVSRERIRQIQNSALLKMRNALSRKEAISGMKIA